MTIVIDGTTGISGVDGTASNPSYEGTDSNTGIFYPAADTVAIGTGGVEAGRFDSSGRLLLGTTTSTNNLRLNERFAIVTAGSATYAGMAITGYSGTSGGARPLFEMQRSRGTTDGSLTKVESGDVIGSLIFRGSDGSAFQDVAEISVAVDGATGAGDTPGRITFATSADGSSSPTERMRISSSGQVTTPNQPAFLATRDSGNQTGLTTNSDLIFASEVYDEGSNYNASTGVFTAPVTGKYLFTCTALFTSITNGQEIDVGLVTSNRLYFFGNPGRLEVSTGVTFGDGYISYGISQIVDMDANDTAFCEIAGLSSGTIALYSGAAWSRFAGYLLG